MVVLAEAAAAAEAVAAVTTPAASVTPDQVLVSLEAHHVVNSEIQRLHGGHQVHRCLELDLILVVDEPFQENAREITDIEQTPHCRWDEHVLLCQREPWFFSEHLCCPNCSSKVRGSMVSLWDDFDFNDESRTEVRRFTFSVNISSGIVSGPASRSRASASAFSFSLITRRWIRKLSSARSSSAWTSLPASPSSSSSSEHTSLTSSFFFKGEVKTSD
ncbi:hypothetical protein WICPIJ_006693 [Wickerhamomyces pijperi]|uniref:Uncharacterized protein n=1 Tax=Wickerhamomyces pijperi TaxID=599730 RepID=A0A9P8TKM4_WICPI|nr:hypothetical protein WICPIJ_006693 [Wickerhamomyces pijperi]